MIEKIYSKIDGKLVHIVNRFDYIKTRTDIVPEENFIQCATLKMEKGKTFPAHKHIVKERHYKEQIAQESWIVIKGSVKCKFYDTDIPQLVKVLEKISNQMEQKNRLEEKRFMLEEKVQKLSIRESKSKQ